MEPQDVPGPLQLLLLVPATVTARATERSQTAATAAAGATERAWIVTNADAGILQVRPRNGQEYCRLDHATVKNTIGETTQRPGILQVGPRNGQAYCR